MAKAATKAPAATNGATNSKTIELADLGPVERLRLEIPQGGGVLILRGRNDCGKSETLQAVTRLLGGQGKITCRDDAAAGEIEGLGVRIRVTRNPRRTGELEAVSLDGALDIADLVDPGIDNAEAADARRIKALVRLSGAKADPAAFYSILPGGREDFYRFVSEATTAEAADLVDLAGRVKRDIERAARAEADQAAHAEAQAQAYRQACEGIDLSAEVDPAALQDALTAAMITQAGLEEQRKRAREANRKATEAADLIAAEQANYIGPSAADATEAANVARLAMLQADTDVEHAKAALRQAQHAAEIAKARHQAASDAAKAAEQHERMMAAWKAAIAELADHNDPTEDQLAQAAQAVADAKADLERGAVARRAQDQAAQADRLEADAVAHRLAAESLREAARSTDDVLSAAVASPTLAVKRGRLVTMHPTRGEVFYCERSHGTRWRIAIDEAIRRIRAAGQDELALLPIPQTSWEGLDPTNRRAIAEHAKARGVVIITAEAADGDLRAEPFATTAA